MRTLRPSLTVVALATVLVTSGPSGIAVAADSSAVRPASSATDNVDLAVMARIRDEGFHRSKVMDTIEHLTDVIGPRLTASPALKQANDWTRDSLAQWGLSNAHLESWQFGRGWTWTHSQVTLVSPRHVELYALPKAWSPAISGTAKGELMKIEVRSEKDLARYKGKLSGKILMIDQPTPTPPGPPRPQQDRRLSASDLADIVNYPVPAERASDFRQTQLERFKLRKALRDFLISEHVLATIDGSTKPWGEMAVQGTGYWKKEDGDGYPSWVMAMEPYQLLRRLLDKAPPVELELQLTSQFVDGDGKVYNTVAEIPGTDKRAEIVMAGAHLDSWHTGTGATDNAAGSAVVLEAARILKAIGVKPRRTIRVALWTGEEEGLLGSTAYVAEHFGARATLPEEKDLPDFMQSDNGALNTKPEYSKLAAYFNIDNGSGKLRGIYAQENSEVVPIFTAWLAPFNDLGATTVTLRNTGSTDHIAYDRIGLPGFQFIQDPLDYGTHTHHTTTDSYDHLEREDLMQASVVLAAFLYDAAMRPEMLPRKMLPPPAPPAPPAAVKPPETPSAQ
jgi:carboxypeptidase Q